jgi:hypothetical protein
MKQDYEEDEKRDWPGILEIVIIIAMGLLVLIEII